MKKIIFTIISVILFVSGCVQYAHENPIKPITGTDIAITFDNAKLGDSTFTVTISPNVAEGGQCSYYAYFIEEADDYTQLDSMKLYQAGYSGIAKSTVKWADNNSITVTVKDLIPNTTYQVYAVAGSEMGIPGLISNASITTPNHLTPSIDGKVAVKDTVATFKFIEPIKRGNKETTFAYMTIYKYNNLKDSVNTEFIKIPEENIVIKNNTLSIKAPCKESGAFVNITYDAGFVENLVGTPCEAFSKKGYNAKKPESSKGLTFRIPIKKWDFVWTEENKAGDTLVYFSDPSKLMPTFEGPDMWWYDYMGDVENAIVVKYSLTNGDKTTEVTMPASKWGMVDDTHIGFFLPEVPDFRTNISMYIAEGIAEDVYGNPNNKYSRENAYCRKLISTGIPGVYSATAPSYFASRGTFTWSISIKENGNGGYTISNFEPYFATNNLAAPLEATYDKTKKQLVIAGGQAIGIGKYTNVVLYGGDNKTVNGSENISTEIPVLLGLDSDGWLTVLNAFGATDNPNEGFWNLMDGGFTFIKISNEPAEVSTPASFMDLSLTGKKIMK
jgi:hypothetical protein